MSELVEFAEVLPTVVLRTEVLGMSASVSMPLAHSTVRWRPRATIGTRVVVRRIQTHEDTGQCFPPEADEVSDFRAVGEVARCSSIRSVLVRFVTLQNINASGVRTNAKTDSKPASTKSSWCQSTSTRPGAEVAGGIDSTNASGEHRCDSETPLSHNVGAALEDMGAPVAADRVDSAVSSELASSASSFKGLTQEHGVSIASSAAPQSIQDATMTVHITFPAGFLVTVLEYVLQQANVWDLVQQRMMIQDYRGTLEVVRGVVAYMSTAEHQTPSGAVISPTHGGANAAPDNDVDPRVIEAEARHSSFLLLCGQLLGRSSQTHSYKPELSVLYAFQARLLFLLEKFTEAIDAASNALACDPTNTEGYFVASSALFAQQRVDDARVVAEACLSQNVLVSPEMHSLVSAIRAAHFYEPILRSFGLDVVPLGLDELMHGASSNKTGAASKAISAATRSVMSPSCIQECAVAAFSNSSGVVPTHSVMRCLSLRRVPVGYAPALSASERKSSSSIVSRPSPTCVLSVLLPAAISSPAHEPFPIVFAERVAVMFPSLEVATTNCAKQRHSASSLEDAAAKQQQQQQRKSLSSCDASVCGFCGFSLLSYEEVVAAATRVHPAFGKLVRSKYPARVPVSCEGAECNLRFCSVVCRSKAYAAFHELECELVGRAAAAMAPDAPPAAQSSSASPVSFLAESPTAGAGRPRFAEKGPGSPRAPRRASDVNFECDDSGNPLRRGSNASSERVAMSTPQASNDCADFARSWSTAFHHHRGSLASEISTFQASPSQQVGGGSGAGRRVSKSSQFVTAKLQFAKRNSLSYRDASDVVGSIRKAVAALHSEVKGLPLPDGAAPAEIDSARQLSTLPLSLRNSLLACSRCVTIVLSLFFPGSGGASSAPAAAPHRFSPAPPGLQALAAKNPTAAAQRAANKSPEIIKQVIARLEERGLSCHGDLTLADKRDRGCLVVAEELFQRVGIPFLAAAATRDWLQPATDSFCFFGEITAVSTSGDDWQRPLKMRDGPQVHQVHLVAKRRLAAFIAELGRLIYERCGNATIAVSTGFSSPASHGASVAAADGTGAASSPIQQGASVVRRVSTVWGIDDENTAAAATGQLQFGSGEDEPNVWTVGRLLRFLLSVDFVDQLWDLCFMSHTLIRTSAPASCIGSSLPMHVVPQWAEFCRQHATKMVVLSPGLSLLADYQRHPYFPTLRFGSNSSELMKRFASVQSIAELRGSSALSIASCTFDDDLSMSSNDDAPTPVSAVRRSQQPSPQPLSTSQQHHSHSSSSQPAVALQHFFHKGDVLTLPAQLAAGGNVFVDAFEPAMGCPGEPRVVVKAMGSISPRDALRLVCRYDDDD